MKFALIIFHSCASSKHLQTQTRNCKRPPIKKKKTPNNEKQSVRFIWKRYQACSYTDVNNHARSGVIPPSYSHAFDADWMWSHIKQRSLYFELYYKPRGSAQAMARPRLFGRPFSGNGLLLDSAVYMACYSLLWMLKKIPLHFYITVSSLKQLLAFRTPFHCFDSYLYIIYTSKHSFNIR